MAPGKLLVPQCIALPPDILAVNWTQWVMESVHEILRRNAGVVEVVGRESGWI